MNEPTPAEVAIAEAPAAPAKPARKGRRNIKVRDPKATAAKCRALVAAGRGSDLVLVRIRAAGAAVKVFRCLEPDGRRAPVVGEDEDSVHCRFTAAEVLRYLDARR